MKENVREWIRVEECGRVGVNAKRKKSEGGRMANRYEEAQRISRYLKDFFTSMIDLTWSKTLLCFCTTFYISWLLFSIVWYLVAYFHGI